DHDQLSYHPRPCQSQDLRSRVRDVRQGPRICNRSAGYLHVRQDVQRARIQHRCRRGSSDAVYGVPGYCSVPCPLDEGGLAMATTLGKPSTIKIGKKSRWPKVLMLIFLTLMLGFYLIPVYVM